MVDIDEGGARRDGGRGRAGTDGRGRSGGTGPSSSVGARRPWVGDCPVRGRSSCAGGTPLSMGGASSSVGDPGHAGVRRGSRPWVGPLLCPWVLLVGGAGWSFCSWATTVIACGCLASFVGAQSLSMGAGCSTPYTSKILPFYPFRSPRHVRLLCSLFTLYYVMLYISIVDIPHVVHEAIHLSYHHLYISYRLDTKALPMALHQASRY